MASLYRRANSPFWYIKYRDQDGKLHQEPIGGQFGCPRKLKVGVVRDNRRAEEVLLECSLVEMKSARSQRGREESKWENWVGAFLQGRYGQSPGSFRRYTDAWNNIKQFFKTRDIQFPASLTRADCFDYMDWRKKQKYGAFIHEAGHNTARLELKILGIIMKEGVLRGYAPANPCRDLGIPKAPPKEKPELTDEDIQFIRSKIALEDDPEKTAFRISWEIALHQGCRLQETCIPLDDVDLENLSITFRKTKTKKVRVAALHPNLVPLFTKLKAERPGANAYDIWPGFNLAWWKFLHRIGMTKKGISFHCTRVTVSTRLNRKLKQAVAQQYVGHESIQEHQRYVKFNLDDQRLCTEALQIPLAHPVDLSSERPGCSETPGDPNTSHASPESAPPPSADI